MKLHSLTLFLMVCTFFSFSSWARESQELIFPPISPLSHEEQLELGMEREYHVDRVIKDHGCCFASKFPLTRSEAFKSGLSHETVSRFKRKYRELKRKIIGLDHHSLLEEEMRYFRNEARKLVRDLLALQEIFFEVIESASSLNNALIENQAEAWELAYTTLYFIEKDSLALDSLLSDLRISTGLYKARAVRTLVGIGQEKDPALANPSRSVKKREEQRRLKIERYEKEIVLFSEFLEHGQILGRAALHVNLEKYDEWKLVRHRQIEVPLRLSYAAGRAVGVLARSGIKGGATIGLGVATANPVVIAGGAFVAVSGCARLVHTIADAHAHNQIDFHPDYSEFEKFERKAKLRRSLARIANVHDILDVLVPVGLAPAAITLGALDHFPTAAGADHLPVGSVGATEFPVSASSAVTHKIPFFAELARTAGETKAGKQ